MCDCQEPRIRDHCEKKHTWLEEYDECCNPCYKRQRRTP
ncbi:MAG: hypothetical protein Homavirus36_6, partial [Homavirus sp.]